MKADLKTVSCGGQWAKWGRCKEVEEEPSLAFKVITLTFSLSLWNERRISCTDPQIQLQLRIIVSLKKKRNAFWWKQLNITKRDPLKDKLGSSRLYGHWTLMHVGRVHFSRVHCSRLALHLWRSTRTGSNPTSFRLFLFSCFSTFHIFNFLPFQLFIFFTFGLFNVLSFCLLDILSFLLFVFFTFRLFNFLTFHLFQLLVF